MFLNVNDDLIHFEDEILKQPASCQDFISRRPKEKCDNHESNTNRRLLPGRYVVKILRNNWNK